VKFSLRDFVTAAAAAQTGLLQGRQAALQDRQQEADQAFHRNLSVFQMGQQMEEADRAQADQQNQSLIQMLPALDDQSRASVLSHVYTDRAQRAGQPREFGMDKLGGILPPGKDYDRLRGLFPHGPTGLPGTPGIAPGAVSPGSITAAGNQGVPGAAPDRYHQAVTPPAAAAALRTGGTGNQGPAPAPITGQPGTVNVPGIGDLHLKDPDGDAAYDSAITAVERRLQDTSSTAVRDPRARAALQASLAKLRTGKKGGQEIGSLGLGAAGLDALNPPATDPKDIERNLTDVDRTNQALQKIAGNLPNDENGQLMRSQIADLIKTAPQRGGSYDPDAVDKWRDRAANYLTLRNNPGQDDRQMVQDQLGHDKRLENLTQLDPTVQASELVDLLDSERDLRKRQGSRRTTAPILESQKDDIEQIRSLQAAGDPEGAGELAKEVVGRIGRKMSPKDQGRNLSALMRHIGDLSQRDANDPALVRKLYQSYGLGYLVDGAPDEALKLGGRRGDAEWTRLTSPQSLAALGKLDPKTQHGVLSEIAGLAKATGRDTIQLPAEVALKLSPEEALRMDSLNLRIAAQEHGLLNARVQHDLENKILAERLKKLRDQNAAGPAGAAGKGGPNGLSTEARRLQHEADQAYDLYKRVFAGQGGLSTFDFDPEALSKDPAALGKAGPDIKRAVTLYQDWRKKAEATKAFIQSQVAPSVGAAANPVQRIAEQKGIDLKKLTPEGLANSYVRRSGGTMTYEEALRKAHATLGR
jgi:hypothetical protein